MTITLDMTFYSKTGSVYSPLGTLTDTATAIFNYTGGDGTDNLCWQNATVGGSAVVGSTNSAPTIPCYNPGTAPHTKFGYEQITVLLGGNYYNVDLYNWDDWNEQPAITFQEVNPGCSTCGTTGLKLPEPITLPLFGAGLAGIAALRRRKKKAA